MIHIFLFNFIYLLLEKGEGREKETERNTNAWLLLKRPALGTWLTTQSCALDWESNWQPFGLQTSTQSTEPHQPGQNKVTLIG